jgi:hypothetical protein
MRVGRSHEEQTNRGASLSKLCDGPNQGEGIKPVIDSPTPDNEVIIGAYSWNHPPQNRRGVFGRAVGESERDHSEKPRKMRVILIRSRANAT